MEAGLKKMLIKTGWNFSQKLMSLLHDESELEEIVKMVGMDALSAPDRLKMEAARSIREDYLHQNSFHEVDTYTSLKKQEMMMELVIGFYEQSNEALNNGADVEKLIKMPVREAIGRFKYTHENDLDEEFDRINDQTFYRNCKYIKEGGILICQKSIEPFRKWQDHLCL